MSSVANAWRSRIDTGMVFINHPTVDDGGLAVRRHQKFWLWRELSSLGIQEFVNKKLVRTSSIGRAGHDSNFHDPFEKVYFHDH